MLCDKNFGTVIKGFEDVVNSVKLLYSQIFIWTPCIFQICDIKCLWQYKFLVVWYRIWQHFF
jgi:hypothetical protein